MNGPLTGEAVGLASKGVPPGGHVHLVGIDPDFRRQAVGTLLYRSFEDACRRYALDQQEFLSWQCCIDCYGLKGFGRTISRS